MIGPKTTMILQRLTTGATTTGAVTHTWADYRTISGVLITSKSVSNSESGLYNKVTDESTHVFNIDFPIGVTITGADRFRRGNDFFDIIYVGDPGTTKRHLECRLMVRDDGSGAIS